MTHFRRSHKKSRNGCLQCKKRRVKCDESGPPCYSCILRELDCSYPNASRARPCSSTASRAPSENQDAEGCFHHQLPQTAQHSAQHLSPTPRDTHFPSRLEELHLMHHFSTSTYKTLCRDHADLEIWRYAIPTVASRFDFLMDGILALASLHIALEDPEKRKPFTAHALSYHNRGLKAFSDALPCIDPDNCDALFAFGIITTLLTLAMCDSRISAVSRTPFDNIVFISKLLKGIGTVVGEHRQWLHSGKFKGLLAKVDTPSSVAPDETCGEAIISARQHIFHYIAGMDESERSVYTAAVGMLDAYSGTESAGLDIGALVAFPLLMDERIVEHLCENRYHALHVLLYYGLLMSQLEDRWWARMFGRQLVSDVNVFINTFHSGYDPAL